jgi:3'-phosphoadenosine 5'-phosphosulfate sulfotransferase (PAPS reductase)/FAD synthetase
MKWHELELEQKRPLDHKIALAVRIIAQALACADLPALAFSAGKDSTVLLDLIRKHFPNDPKAINLPILYGNTGVEFPECVKFARALTRDWNLNLHVARPGRTIQPGYKYAGQRRIWQHLIDTDQIHHVLKTRDGRLKSTQALERACPPALRAELERDRLIWPVGSKQSYFWCADQYGWPILGKNWSRLNARRINIDTFLRFSSSDSQDPQTLAYYKILRQAKISQHCCNVLKKNPAERIQAGLGVDLIFKGLMAAESRSRAINFLTRGHLFEGAARPHLRGRPFFHCQPIATWTDADIWTYIRRYDVPYASLYDVTYTALDGTTQKIKRNGCYGCATDIRFKDNHLRILRQTHPRMWTTLMRAGMADQIRNLQHALRPAGQLTLTDIFDTTELIAMQPCVFDDLDGRGGTAPPPGLVYDPELPGDTHV